MNEKRFFYFHIGRGGMHNNANHKSFVKLVSENEITNNLSFYERDENGKFFNTYTDDTGRPIVGKRELDEDIRNGFVVLDFDGIYDTDIYLAVDRLDEKDFELINKSDSFDARDAIAMYLEHNKIEAFD